MFKYATELKPGNYAIIEVPCIVKSVDISKTGKHGSSKVRIEAIGIVDGKKRIVVLPGSERVAIPTIEKRKAQVLSVNKQEMKAELMDLETFENVEASVDEELKDKIDEGKNVEYWKVENQYIVKRLI